MNGPRIVIMQLSSPRQVTQWQDHCRSALGGDAAASTSQLPDNRVVWQLSSANHRALARSVRVYATVDDALAEMQDTRDRFGQFKARSLKVSTRSEYAWVASIGDDKRLMSARAYSTVRDTRDAIVSTTELFLSASVVHRARTLAAAG